MKKGIAILGLNGSGKSTLTHALANKLGYYEMDIEDYYFPEQKVSRQMALDAQYGVDCEHLGALPFSKPRGKDEVQSMILADIMTHPKFILAGVTMNWCNEILSKINMAFLVEAPIEERLRRIENREVKRFGSRALLGGDMYKQQVEFRKVIANKSSNAIEDSVKKLLCPVITLDGTMPISKNIELIITHIEK